MFNFTAWPEMLAWPYLMLQGWLPYRDIAIAHNPLLLLDLAIFFKLFGVGIIQLKIYTWILIAINTYLVYFVSKKFWNKKTAYLSSILYILLTIIFEGNGLWFDLALTPFAILLYYFLRQKNYLWTGIIFALGFLTKQTFIYFAIPVVIATVQSAKYLVPRLKQLIIGSGIIFGIFAAVLYMLGILDDYYRWAVEFGIFYLPSAEGQISLPNLRQFLFAMFPFFVAVLSTKYLVLSFMVAGMMGVYPRWELFHFQPALPFLAMALSVLVVTYKNRFVMMFAILLATCYILLGLYKQFGTTTRFYEDDVQTVVSLLTADGSLSTLYVINYWDNLYALTYTTPPKPLIPFIPWYLSYNNNEDLIVNNLKTEMVDAIVIGERQNNHPKLYEFVDRFYSCSIVVKKVEVCYKHSLPLRGKN